MWGKGQSGNPGGRPKGWTAVVKAAREKTTEAMETLVTAMREADKWAVRVKAAEIILDRGWGRPTQPIEIEELSDEQRAARLAAILDSARARRAGRSVADGPEEYGAEPDDGNTH